WDQQWSLRVQQILAMETDLLEYEDIFAGSHVVEAKTAELIEASEAELEDIAELGGVFEAIDELKGRLVQSHAERMRRIESGEQTVIGVNEFTETAPSPLGGAESILRVDPQVQDELIADVVSWRANRDDGDVRRCLDELRRAAAGTDNIMGPTIALAHAGGTTGEWADCLREEYGEYRAPTGVRAASSLDAGLDGDRARLGAVAARMRSLADGPPRILIAKPGLDGHSNGAEQIAVAARDAGMEVIYEGIRSTPTQIAAVARDEDPDAIGLSILSGSHMELVPETLARLTDEGVGAPVVVGGIIPAEDQATLLRQGVAAVFTPKDYRLAQIIEELAELALAGRGSETTG
ncbi:MAG: methylmalonyl-CoA mutase family protein, partial [Acidimicrobiales bacterium]